MLNCWTTQESDRVSALKLAMGAGARGGQANVPLPPRVQYCSFVLQALTVITLSEQFFQTSINLASLYTLFIAGVFCIKPSLA